MHAIVKLCRRLVQESNLAAGKDALRLIESPGAAISGSNAEQCLLLMLEGPQASEAQDNRDAIIASLVRHCPSARLHLASRLQQSVTVVFEQVFEIGDGSANGLATVVRDSGAWPTGSSRETYEKDVFQLFVAKLLESGHDYEGRALKGISRLLATNAVMLQSLVDEEIFDAILASLDIQLPMEVRSQATLATAKYLEVSRERGQSMLSKFITSRITRHTNDDLILAFSAAAAVFPLVPSVASELFLTEGFLPSLIPQLEHKSKYMKVEQAALDMLSAACIDGGCREAIGKHCTSWLQGVLKAGKDQRSGQAAVILTKIHSATITTVSDKSSEEEKDSQYVSELVPRLRDMLIDGGDTAKQNSIEGLAYASMEPKVKEKLIKDKKFLRQLLDLPQKEPVNTTTAFGSLTLIDNLARYRPNLSEEQKRISQLKAYANASKTPPQPDSLDDDAYVTDRCKALLEAGAVPFLVALNKNTLPKQQSRTTLGLIANILLSLSKPSSSRGIIAQQGGVPLLLEIYKHNSEARTDIPTPQIAAHALARILISVNPALVFGNSGSPSSISALPPLLSLLRLPDPNTTDTPRDLLPTFEGLLALTNLVSGPSPKLSEELIRSSFATVEDLLLSNNTAIQRAATELTCNLMTCPAGIEKFADGSKPAKRRLHVLLALADVDDVATRRAAGGALAMVTEFEGAVEGVLDRERGMEILLGLCGDEDEGCVHRGVVCVRNVVLMGGELGKKGGEVVKGLDGVDILKEVLRKSNNQAVLEVGVEVSKALMG